MIELISLIAKSLVKQPDAVSVTMVQKGNVEVYELHVCLLYTSPSPRDTR